jgi:serine/threonine protein kinase
VVSSLKIWYRASLKFVLRKIDVALLNVYGAPYYYYYYYYYHTATSAQYMNIKKQQPTCRTTSHAPTGTGVFGATSMNGGEGGAATGRNLMGKTGTYRYMAPKVIRHEAYSSSVDVYSFAIMVWQFLTHEDPFLDVPSTEAARLVAFEQQQPPLPKKTPKALVDLIQTNWSDQPREWWDFEKVTAMLQQIQETSIMAEEKKWLEASYDHPIYSCEEEDEVEDEIAMEQKQQKGAFRRQPKLKAPDTNGPKQGGSRLSNFFGVHKKTGKKQ